MTKLEMNHDWSELAVLGHVQKDTQLCDVFVRIDTSCISDYVLKNSHILTFFQKLPILEKYLEFIDKRVAKCKETWMKFFRPFKANFAELQGRIKAREDR